MPSKCFAATGIQSARRIAPGPGVRRAVRFGFRRVSVSPLHEAPIPNCFHSPNPPFSLLMPFETMATASASKSSHVPPYFISSGCLSKYFCPHSSFAQASCSVDQFGGAQAVEGHHGRMPGFAGLSAYSSVTGPLARSGAPQTRQRVSWAQRSLRRCLTGVARFVLNETFFGQHLSDLKIVFLSQIVPCEGDDSPVDMVFLWCSPRADIRRFVRLSVGCLLLRGILECNKLCYVVLPGFSSLWKRTNRDRKLKKEGE